MVMTLKEAIAHAHEKGKGDDECAAEHRSLAMFLEELLMYRQTTAIIIGENAVEHVGRVYLKKPDAARIDFSKNSGDMFNSFMPNKTKHEGPIQFLEPGDIRPVKAGTSEKDEVPHDGSACFYRTVEYDIVEHKGLYPGQHSTLQGRRRVRCAHPTVLKAMSEHIPPVTHVNVDSLPNKLSMPLRQHSVHVPTTIDGVTYACAGCTLCTSKPIEGA